MPINSLKRNPDESLKDFKVRLCSEKDLHGFTWEQVADILNEEYGENFGSSTYRKWFTAFYDGQKYEQEKGLSDNELINELELKRIGLEKEKIKMRDMRNEYNKSIREDARIDLLKESIMDLVNEINKIKPINIAPFVKRENLDQTREGIALLSDFHFGQEVDLWNSKYSIDIFNKKFDKYFAEIIRYGKLNNLNKITILNLNDLVSGIIQHLIRIEQNTDVITQIQYVSEKLTMGLSLLAENFEMVNYYSVTSNHSRVSANKKESLDKENFDRIIDWYLVGRLRDIANINIYDQNIHDEIAIFDICGRYKAIAVHGHRDNIKNVTQDLSLLLGFVPNYIFTSHIHHNNEYEPSMFCEVIANPSAVSCDNYAHSLRKASKARQKFMVFNEEGRECTYFINL